MNEFFSIPLLQFLSPYHMRYTTHKQQEMILWHPKRDIDKEQKLHASNHIHASNPVSVHKNPHAYTHRYFTVLEIKF